MKRKVLWLAAAIAALSMPVGTLAADPGVTLVKTIQKDVSWVEGSNLLKIRGNNGYYMATLDETPLTEEGFYSFYAYRNYIEAQKYYDGGSNNVTGMYAKDGKLLVPCQYGSVKELNKNWIVACTYKPSDANNFDTHISFFGGDTEDLYVLIDKVDFYHVADGTAALVGSLTRDTYLDSNATGNYVAIENRADHSIKLYDSSFQVVAENLRSVYDNAEVAVDEYYTYRENGQEGVKDEAGNVILAPQYQYVYDISNGYAEVSNGEKYGLMSLSGQLVVPVEYDDIQKNYETSSYVSAGYVAVVKDGKLGYVDLNGNVTMQPTYSKDILDVSGASALLQDLEGNMHILAADGVDTVLDDAHKDVRVVYDSNGLLYRFEDENYDYGVIDWHGNEVFPVGLNSVNASGDGNYLMVSKDYDNYDIYQIDFGAAQEPAVEETEQAAVEAEPETVASEAAVQEAANQEATEAAETAGAEEAQEVVQEAIAEGGNIAGALVSSALELAGSDLEKNKDGVLTILNAAKSLLSEGQENAGTVLDSAITLINSGTASADSVVAVLQSVASLLG